MLRSTSTLADPNPNLNHYPNINPNLNPKPNPNHNHNLNPYPNLKLNPNPKPNPLIVISAWQHYERLWVMRFVYYNI